MFCTTRHHDGRHCFSSLHSLLLLVWGSRTRRWNSGRELTLVDGVRRRCDRIRRKEQAELRAREKERIQTRNRCQAGGGVVMGNALTSSVEASPLQAPGKNTSFCFWCGPSVCDCCQMFQERQAHLLLWESNKTGWWSNVRSSVPVNTLRFDYHCSNKITSNLCLCRL